MPDNPHGKDIGRSRGDVGFDDVNFSYDGRRPALVHFSLQVPAALQPRPGAQSLTKVHGPPRATVPAVAQLVPIGLVAHGKCRFLGANGRLGKARKCSKAVFLAAKVKNGPRKLTSWTFKKKVSLPLGRYVVAVRGVDPKGHRELIPRTTNNASFILYAHGKTKVPHRRPH